MPGDNKERQDSAVPLNSDVNDNKDDDDDKDEFVDDVIKRNDKDDQSRPLLGSRYDSRSLTFQADKKAEEGPEEGEGVEGEAEGETIEVKEEEEEEEGGRGKEGLDPDRKMSLTRDKMDENKSEKRKKLKMVEGKGRGGGGEEEEGGGNWEATWSLVTFMVEESEKAVKTITSLPEGRRDGSSDLSPTNIVGEARKEIQGGADDGDEDDDERSEKDHREDIDGSYGESECGGRIVSQRIMRSERACRGSELMETGFEMRARERMTEGREMSGVQ